MNVTFQDGAQGVDIETSELRAVYTNNEREVSVTVTYEGVIVDAYSQGQFVGVMGMTFEEWYERIELESAP
ncbi:MAG: hypothetical protein ACRDZY_08030 [Acidimicrobiales bacterium]